MGDRKYAFSWSFWGTSGPDGPTWAIRLTSSLPADLTTGCFTYMSPSVYSLRGMTAEDALREYIADSMPEESYRRSSSPRKSPSNYGLTYTAGLRRWA